MLREALLEARDYAEKVRKKYLRREVEGTLKGWLKKDLIKVITGPRRAGKTWLSIGSTKDEVYLNFEDDRILRYPPEEVIKAARDVFGEKNVWIFDEVQHLSRWEIVVERMRRKGYDVIVTGSNSSLLSKELSTILTGRHIDITVLPFSFREFLRALRAKPTTALLEEYLKKGGYPEVVLKRFDRDTYIRMLFTDILTKDVIFRYRPKYVEALRELALFIIRHTGSPLSIENMLRGSGIGSHHTLKKYLTYLQEAFLIFPLQPAFGRYWSKGPLKFYPVDPAFVAVEKGERMGVLLETAVFLELKRRGYSVYYYRKGDLECDFLVKIGEKLVPIQVTYHLTLENLRRETACIKKLGKRGKVIALHNDTDYPALSALSFFLGEVL